jgi:prepilin-type processing-associated H-X9-DG protein
MRRAMILPAVLLGACLAALPACKKKDSGGGGGGDPAGDPAPPAAPSAVSSDFVLYARLDAKAIRDSALVAEVKQAITKAGGTAEWDKIEGEAARDVGVKLTEIDSASVWVTEVPPRAEPKTIAIVTATKAFDKTALLKGRKTTPDARGFYTVGGGGLMHFPDDKTFVAVHPDLAQQYLDGYAKNRSGWPVTADLTRSAAGHTAFVVLNLQKVPREMMDLAGGKEFAPFLAAQTVTLTADLKGKELGVAARATFPDAAAAGKAKEAAQGLLGQATAAVQGLTGGKESAEMAPFMPAVKEGQRALKAAKVEVVGSDLTVAGAYRADFNVEQMVADAVKQWKETGPRLTAQNNLKQVGLALHNYESANGRLVIHGTGATGAAVKNPTEKPLLSWRVAILPYVEQGALYNEFKLNEPWDSAHNKKLIEKMPKIFAPPAPGKPGYTHLQMVVGPGAMQPGATIGAIPDGTSNTIAVLEAADPVIWTKPDDVTLPPKPVPGALKKKFGGQFPGGFNVVMWDGSVRFIRDSVSERTLSLLVNPNDGEVLPSDW